MYPAKLARIPQLIHSIVKFSHTILEVYFKKNRLVALVILLPNECTSSFSSSMSTITSRKKMSYHNCASGQPHGTPSNRRFPDVNMLGNSHMLYSHGNKINHPYETIIYVPAPLAKARNHLTIVTLQVFSQPRMLHQCS